MTSYKVYADGEEVGEIFVTQLMRTRFCSSSFVYRSKYAIGNYAGIDMGSGATSQGKEYVVPLCSQQKIKKTEQKLEQEVTLMILDVTHYLRSCGYEKITYEAVE